MPQSADDSYDNRTISGESAEEKKKRKNAYTTLMNTFNQKIVRYGTIIELPEPGGSDTIAVSMLYPPAKKGEPERDIYTKVWLSKRQLETVSSEYQMGQPIQLIGSLRASSGGSNFEMLKVTSINPTTDEMVANCDPNKYASDVLLLRTTKEAYTKNVGTFLLLELNSVYDLKLGQDANGMWQEETHWYKTQVWSSTFMSPEKLRQHSKSLENAGSVILVTGFIDLNTYVDKNGDTQSTTVFRANKLSIIDAPGESSYDLPQPAAASLADAVFNQPQQRRDNNNNNNNNGYTKGYVKKKSAAELY